MTETFRFKNKFCRSLLFLVPLLFVAASSFAQIWVPVTHPTGTRVINGRAVTVTSAGSTRTDGTFAYCGAAPYTIGINTQGIPGSFTYQFAPATTNIRFKISATNIGEIISFYINGTQYMLTPANILPFPACDTQFQLPLTAVGGNAVFLGPTVPGQSWFGNIGSGIVEINYPTGINSIRIENNGIQGGSSFGVAYWGFYAEAFNDSTCNQDTLHLYGGPTEPNITYLWTGPNGFTSTDQNPIIPYADFQHAGPYVLRTVLNADTAYDTTIVRIRMVPAAPVVTGDSIICEGNSAYLSALSSTSGVNYRWDGPNNYRGTSPNANIRNIRNRDTGVYSVVAELNGCLSDPTDVRVQVVYPVEGDTIPVQICSGGSFDFHGQTITEEGIYSKNLFGMASNGCDSLAFISVSFAPPPRDTITAAICQGSTYVFGDTVVSEAGFYTRDIKTLAGCDSIVVLDLIVNLPAQDTISARICRGEHFLFADQALTEAGEYLDTVKTSEGCDSVVVLKLTVNELPIMSADYVSDRIPCIGDTIQLIGSGGIDYAWYRNNRPIGTLEIQPFNVMEPENIFTLVVADENGCIDSTSYDLIAISCCNVFVPNAFTPNNDGRNDQFRVTSESRMYQYQMDIVNRWGRTIFSTPDPNTGWDGNIDGQPADVGTYFYQIKAKCISGKEIYLKGDLMLIR